MTALFCFAFSQCRTERKNKRSRKMNTALIIRLYGVCIIFFVTDVFPSATIALLAASRWGVRGMRHRRCFSGSFTVSLFWYSHMFISAAQFIFRCGETDRALFCGLQEQRALVVLIVTTLSALLRPLSETRCRSDDADNLLRVVAAEKNIV